MTLYLGGLGPCSTLGHGIFVLFLFCFFVFNHIFLHIGFLLFIHTAAPLQLHKVLQGDLYSSLYLSFDL